MDRRQFLTITGAAGVAAVWGGTFGCASSAASSGAAAVPGAFPLSSIGVQLYTVRSLAEKNVEQTFQQVAAAGYRFVETHSLYGKPASEIRALLDKAGLRSVSGHYSLTELEESPNKAFDTAKTLGQEFVVLNWLEPSLRTIQFYAGFPERLNKIGANARAAGLRFAHHNHEFEFETVGGPKSVIETVIARTDPALVSLELDAYWVFKADADPVRFIEQHGSRIAMVHLKDSTSAPSKAIADVGKGVIDFGKVLAAAQKAGVRYAFVERDDATDSLGSIRSSREYLTSLLAAR